MKIDCGAYDIPMIEQGNCLKADTSWNGYISAPKGTVNPPQGSKKCYSCDEVSVNVDTSKCPREQKCGAAPGAAVQCLVYSDSEELKNFCRSGQMSTCMAGQPCPNGKRVALKNPGVSSCDKYGGPQVVIWYQMEIGRHPVLRCLKRWPNDSSST